jgi:hypothetical protein
MSESEMTSVVLASLAGFWSTVGLVASLGLLVLVLRSRPARATWRQR